MKENRFKSSQRSFKSILADLRNKGLTFSDCVQEFGVDVESSRIAATARDIYHREGEIQIDGRTVLSHGEDGTYVMAWVFVDKNLFQQAQTGTHPEENISCSECDSTLDVVSTYCGSFCPEHLAGHIKICEICAADFK